MTPIMAQRRAKLTNEDLDRALARGELVLFAQPQLALTDGRPRGCEMFVRWRHPERGMIQPRAFLSYADIQGRTGEITRFVVGEALASVRAWRRAGRAWRAAVNLAPSDLLEASFAASLETRLARHDVGPDALILELPSPTLMTGSAFALATLRDLRAAGFAIALDGEPMPAAAFEALRPSPAMQVKVQRSFIAPFRRLVDVRATAELASLLASARLHGAQTIAVGIETEAELELARDLGFALAQGHYFCRAVAFEELEDWTRAWLGPDYRPAALPRLSLIEGETGAPAALAGTSPVHLLHRRLREIALREPPAGDRREEEVGLRIGPEDERAPRPPLRVLEGGLGEEP